MFGISQLVGKFFSVFGGWGVAYFMSLGGSTVNVNDLNKHLQNSGYPSVSPFNIFTSGELGIFAKRYFVSKRNLNLWHRNYYNSSNLVGFGGSCWYLSFGKYFDFKDIKFLPQIGIGKSQVDLIVGKNVVDFDSLLSNPGSIMDLNRESLVLAPYLRVFTKKKWVLFLSGGVGYILPIYKFPWEIKGVGRVRGPSTALGGIIFDLGLGLGILID
ncbi:MAG: hypothetical protein ABIL16_05350 [candidate division WOR-3 bacterium]